MITRAEVIAEARTWIDTPWHHQAHRKGVGVDCAGLLRGVMMALGLAEPDVSRWPGADELMGYSAFPDGVSFRKACEKYLIPIPRSAMRPGDIVELIVDVEPQHIGILTPYRNGGFAIVHAASRARPPRVIETRLMFSQTMRFSAAYSFPGVS